MAIVRTTTNPGEIPDPKKQPTTKPIARATAGRAGVGRTLAPSRGQAPAQRGAFINDTMAELRRVVWPPRDQVRSGTIVTIGLLIFFGLYIYGIDRAIEWIFSAVGLYADRGQAVK